MAEFPQLPIFTDALLGDTQHLSTTEFGAYMLMLIVAWRTPECALPNDQSFLARITRCGRNWDRISQAILPFWSVGADGLLYQKRLTEVRLSVHTMVEQRKSAGRASALKRLHRPPTSVEFSLERNDHENSASKTKSKSKEDSNSVFDAWWSIYPRKEGKISARKVFDRILSKKLATVDDLIAGARAYSERKSGTETQYIKQPTTWLNGGHWADDVTPAAVPTGGLFGSAKPVPLGACRDRTPEEWKQPLYLFIRQGFWRDDGVDGAPPISEGCVAPKELLDIARAIWNRQGQMPVETKYSIVTRPTPFWGDNVVALPARTG